MRVGDLWSRSFFRTEPFDRPPYPHSRSMISILLSVPLAETFWEKNGPFRLLGRGMPGGAEEELEFGAAVADSFRDPFFDE